MVPKQCTGETKGSASFGEEIAFDLECSARVALFCFVPLHHSLFFSDCGTKCGDSWKCHVVSENQRDLGFSPYSPQPWGQWGLTLSIHTGLSQGAPGHFTWAETSMRPAGSRLAPTACQSVRWSTVLEPLQSPTRSVPVRSTGEVQVMYIL